MVKTPFFDENGLKKGTWSPEEDNKLRSYIQRYGHWNWKELPKFAGLARCGKSCRLRWINYLRPNVKHGNYSKEEEDLIIKLHKQLGNRWSKIAASLPDRIDNEVKNYWHTHLKKRVQYEQHATPPMKQKRSTTKNSTSHQKPQTTIDNHNISNNGSNITKYDLQILESCPLSPQLFDNNSESSSIATSSNNSDHTSNILSLSTLDAMGEVLDETFWTKPFILETFEEQDNELDLRFSDGGLLFSPSMSYWERMDFSCFLEDEVLK